MSEKKLREQIAQFLINNEPVEVDWNWNYADSILTLFKEYVKEIENPYEDSVYAVEQAKYNAFNQAISKVMEGLE
jgi:hypothetical protein